MNNDLSGNPVYDIEEQNRIFNESLYKMIHDYNDNINYYNGNIRRFIEMFQTRQNHENNRVRFYQQLHNQYQYPSQSHQPQSPPQSSRMYPQSSTLPSQTRSPYGNYPSTRTTRNLVNSIPLPSWLNVRNGISSLFEDVIIRPTPAQIENAVEEMEYSGNGGGSCPITLEPFEENETICKIRHCGHIFKKNALNDWFSRNVRCPICRYDIRNYGSDTENEESKEQEPSNASSRNPRMDQEAGVPLPLNNLSNYLQRWLRSELLNNPDFDSLTFDIHI